MEKREGAFDFREDGTELFEEGHALVDRDRAAKIVSDGLGQVGDAVFALLEVSLELPVICHARVVQLVHQPVDSLLSQPRFTMFTSSPTSLSSSSVGKGVTIHVFFFFFSVLCLCW